MYFIDNKRGNEWGVVDTKDNVEEFYTEEQLRSFNIEIYGLYDDCIFISATPKMIEYWVKQGFAQDVVLRMPLHVTFEFYLKDKKANGLNMISHYHIRVYRSRIDEWVYNDGKGYKFLDIDTLKSELDWYFWSKVLISVSHHEN